MIFWLLVPEREWGWGGGILRISSDRDDRMGPKIKTQKSPWDSQQNPKKSLDQKLSPQKSHAEFLSLENLQKGKPVCLYLNHRTTWLGYAGTMTNLQIVLNSQKNPYLNQATQKNILAKFFYPKKSQNQKFQTQKNSWITLVIPWGY